MATPENMELLKQILAQLDKIPEQVMIETLIVEATLDNSSKFGVEWKYASGNPLKSGSGTGTSEGNFGLGNASPALQGFRYTLTGGDLTGFINMLQTDKKFQVLSTPRIFTSNNVEAQINISQSIPYVLSTREDANGNLTFNYAFQDVGIVLTVTPRITANGYVTMDVNQTANDLQGFTDFNAPIVNQRQADTTVSVRDGETIILGGIIRNNVTSTVKKVPLLGDIPILGNLFRSTDKSNVKTELLVFLTPRIVKDPEEARKLREDELKRLSKPTQKALEPELRRGYDPDKDKKHSNPPDTTGKGGGGN
ncbi:MAG: type II secretion system protein GspD [Fimbriimonadaceae bacterium]|nr:type II secretion system protein GspD [Fimbriimonadaceae bacterium]